MLINTHNLRTLGVSFKSTFQAGIGMHTPLWSRIAMQINSTTAQNEYGWLGEFPGMREWVGDRVIHSMEGHEYTIKNRDFEGTVRVRRNDILDDNVGIYAPRFQMLGKSAAGHADKLVFDLLMKGFSEPCYDSQPFFDTEHPVLDKDGETTFVSNSGGGSGVPWFLLDVSQPIKPLILQVRKENEFVAKDDPDDDNVFMRKEFVYGVDNRKAVGFGLWQLAYGSKQELNIANYKAARAAIREMKADYGEPLGLVPNLLVVGPGMEQQALELLNADRNEAGATNVWRNTAELLVAPRLVA